MKIAIVTDAWRPQINGVVTTYLETIRELRRLGHQVLTITPQRFFSIPCPTYPEIPLSLVTPLRIRHLLTHFAPQAVHIATEGPVGWAARRACLAAGFPFTTAYHTRFPEYIRMRFPIPLSLCYRVVRRFHNAAARIMVSTGALKNELEHKGFNRVFLWSRGVDTTLFRPGPSIDRSNNERIFTYVGRVAPEKNIEAFLTINLPGRKVVIGDGPALPALRNRYPDVTFTGFKQGRELADLVAASSVFVFPSLTDTFGVVQLEAMACGVPVAAYPVDGPRAVIKNGYNGWMADDLSVAVNNCLAIDPNHCRHFALGHSWQASTGQFLANLCFQEHSFADPAALKRAA
jgi:glycosyltransferase involved in cell wall biosynthesis